LKILEEADGCSEGEIGALLRREGLYSSHLTTWRRQRGESAIQALGKKRGRKAKPRDKEKEQLVKENARLRRKIEQAEKIIEIQKKVSALLAESESNDESGESE
jgi:transposase-like protein